MEWNYLNIPPNIFDLLIGQVRYCLDIITSLILVYISQYILETSKPSTSLLPTILSTQRAACDHSMHILYQIFILHYILDH